MFITEFFITFKTYFVEIFFPLLGGLVASGIIHEFVPDKWVDKHLGKKGIRGILYSTLIGTVVPVCCWGSLPIAVSFHKKGASLGPVFAILIATPATSLNALFVAWKFFGGKFTVYIFLTVILMGIIAGLIGNLIKVKPDNRKKVIDEKDESNEDCCCSGACRKSLLSRVKSVLKYAFIDMPKEIGLEVIIGIALAALVSTAAPIGLWIKSYLSQGFGYLFALVFGIGAYMCATMSVPLVHAFVSQGLNIGAGLSLLVLGPITSFGTLLVLRKEFGIKTLFVFLALSGGLSLLAGYLFTHF